MSTIVTYLCSISWLLQVSMWYVIFNSIVTEERIKFHPIKSKEKLEDEGFIGDFTWGLMSPSLELFLFWMVFELFCNVLWNENVLFPLYLGIAELNVWEIQPPQGRPWRCLGKTVSDRHPVARQGQGSKHNPFWSRFLIPAPLPQSTGFCRSPPLSQTQAVTAAIFTFMRGYFCDTGEFIWA